MVEQLRYIDDAHIEIEVEAGLPDFYVAQQAERLKLYRELDSTKDEEALLEMCIRDSALRDNLPERPATAAVEFDTAPQPKFNKNFEMLADDMIRNSLRGYTRCV